MKIPISKTIFDETEKQAITRPLETGWVVQGPYVNEFQQLFINFTGASYAEATSNCTTALHLGLIAMGIGTNDKVIVPAFSYVASANAVEHSGASVVFCDIDLQTYNINTQHLEKLLNIDSSIKAIMPVHLFGLCADMPAIMKLAKKYNVKVIEDAACGFDAWIEKQHAGTFGDCGCFSFHPRKSITTGEGGMLISQNKVIAKLVSQLKDHGANKSDLERHKEKGGSLLPDFSQCGFNYRMTDLQGALGVAQMQKATKIMQGRRKIAAQYNQALKKYKSFLLPSTPKNYIHAYQAYVILFLGNETLKTISMKKIDEVNIQRNFFMDTLEKNGIATRQGTHAIHTLSYYKHRYQIQNHDYVNAYAADRLSIALPLYANMTDEEFNYVIKNIHEALIQCAEFVE